MFNFILKKNNSQLYIRFVLLIIVIVSLTTIILSSVLYANFESQTSQIIRSSAQDSLSQISYSATIMCELAKSMALQIYFDDQLFSLLSQPPADHYEVQNMLRKIEAYKMTNPHIYSIYIYNRNANKFYSSRYYDNPSDGNSFYDFEIKEIIDDFKDYKQFTPIARKIPNALAPETDRYTNVFSFVFSDKKSSSVLENAVIINISEEWLSKTINSLEYVPNSSTFIVDKTGKILVNHMQQNKESILNSSKDYLDKIFKASSLSGSFFYNVNGIPSLVSYTKLNTYDLIFVRTTPYNNIFEQIYQLRLKTVIIVLVVLVAGIIISVLVSKRSYRPVAKLVSELDTLQSEKRSVFLELRNKFLKELLFNNTEEEIIRLKDRMSYYNIALNLNQNFLIILLSIDHYSTFINSYTTQDRELMKFSISNIASEVFSETFANESLQLEGDRHNILILNTNHTSIEEIKEIIYSLSHKTQLDISSHLNLSITITVSNIVSSSTSLTPLYYEVLTYSHYRLLHGHQSIIFPFSISPKQPEYFIYPIDEEKKLVDSLRLHKFSESKRIYNEIVKTASEYTYIVLSSTIHRLAVCIDMTIDVLKSTMGMPLSCQVNNFTAAIGQLETLSEINNEFYKMFDSLYESLEYANTKDEHVELVKKVIKYISKNFSNANLSLEIIAESFDISTNYLGKIFKRQLSLSVSDYVNNVRMEKVKELLLNTDMTINEIITSAGYINAKYFSTLFKKTHGVTPSAYRKIDSNNKLSS